MFPIDGNSSYVVLYTQCLRYNICSAWYLDIRISSCLSFYSIHLQQVNILISKNQALQIYLKHHDNVYKTP